MVALDVWDHFGRRVTPMLAVYATATVAVTPPLWGVIHVAYPDG